MERARALGERKLKIAVAQAVEKAIDEFFDNIKRRE